MQNLDSTENSSSCWLVPLMLWIISSNKNQPMTCDNSHQDQITTLASRSKKYGIKKTKS